jgi:5-methylcytosine-specific restriction endonuclease McrA
MATAHWTEARLKSFIVSALRGAFRKFPTKYEVLNAAFTGKKTNKKTKRLSSHYLCNSCQEEFPTSEVNVDHIYPVVSPDDGFTTWDKFISNLFCPPEHLQVLCKTCHDAKTLRENKQRRENVKNKKSS